MEQRLTITVLALLLAQVGSLSLSLSRHDDYSNTCFYYYCRFHQEQNGLNYQIKNAWTTQQGLQIESGALKASDFISVEGSKTTNNPNMFQDIVYDGIKILESLQYVKPVLENSDAPQYNLSTQYLQQAFGNPSKGGLYRVPSGKVLLGLRFLLFGSQTPDIGGWNFFCGLVNDDLNLKKSLNAKLSQLKFIFKKNATTLHVASSLNLTPQSNERRIFKYFKNQPPPTGTIESLTYTSFMVVIRAGQEILAGLTQKRRIALFIENVQDRSYCG